MIYVLIVINYILLHILDLICISFKFPKVEAYITDFRYFPLSNILIKCSKSPNKHCFCCMPQFLICCLYFYLFQNILMPLDISSLTYALFRGVLFNLQVFEGFSSYSLTGDFLITSNVIWEHHLYDFYYFKFALVFLYGPEYGLSWWKFHINLTVMSILLWVYKLFYKCQVD